MSDVADEELLNDEEFDYESYDLGCEEEDALLEEDTNKDYGSGDEVDFKRKRKDLDKKDSVSETDEQEDVLNLDVEDDFQDDDKEEAVIKNKKKEGKFVNERTPSSSNISVTKVPPKPLLGKRPLHNTKPTNSVSNQQNKKFPRNIGNRRGRGVGRGNFQQRSTFIRNNNITQDRRPGRRNGTVFINPKYEGFVQINENNARLAWDNQTYSQNNTTLIPPWNGGNVMGNTNDQSLLINNLVEMITQTPNLLQLPPVPPPQTSVLNFEPPPNVYQNQVLFPPITTMQPPPYNNNSQNLLTAQWDHSYNTSNQTQGQPPPLFQPYTSGPQQFNHPPPSNNFNYSNNESNNQTNYATGPRRNFPPQKNTFRNNFNKQENYPQSGNCSQNTYQNKNQTFNNYYGYENRNMNNRQENYNKGLGTNNYQQRNIKKREDFKIEVSSSQNAQNRTVRQFYSKNEESHDQNCGNFQKEQRKRNFTNPRNRRPLSSNNSEVKLVSPEKKMKMEENVKKEESVVQNQQPTTTSNPVTDEEEDEEMRLYRLKIEEQKRERERVLKMKEERRRMMLLQQKKEEEKSQTTPPEKPATTISPQKTNFQRTINQPVLTTLDKFTTSNSQPLVEEDPPNLSFKITNNLQRTIPTETVVLKNDSSSGSKFLSNRAVPTTENVPSSRNFLLNRPIPSTENPRPKKDLSASNFMSNRVVIVKNKSDNNDDQSGVLLNSPINTDSGDDTSQGLSSFLNSRKILKKDNLFINTRLVVINNLSASTTENKLVAMARGIGDIQKLRMDKQERQATILFKSVATAHAFFKKYQRHMLDLSMIQVKLEPML